MRTSATPSLFVRIAAWWWCLCATLAAAAPAISFPFFFEETAPHPREAAISDMRYQFAIIDAGSNSMRKQTAVDRCATLAPPPSAGGVGAPFTIAGIFSAAVQARLKSLMEDGFVRADVWFDGTDSGSEGKWRYENGLWAGVQFYDAAAPAGQRCSALLAPSPPYAGGDGCYWDSTDARAATGGPKYNDVRAVYDRRGEWNDNSANAQYRYALCYRTLCHMRLHCEAPRGRSFVAVSGFVEGTGAAASASGCRCHTTATRSATVSLTVSSPKDPLTRSRSIPPTVSVTRQATATAAQMSTNTGTASRSFGGPSTTRSGNHSSASSSFAGLSASASAARSLPTHSDSLSPLPTAASLSISHTLATSQTLPLRAVIRTATATLTATRSVVSTATLTVILTRTLPPPPPTTEWTGPPVVTIVPDQPMAVACPKATLTFYDGRTNATIDPFSSSSGGLTDALVRAGALVIEVALTTHNLSFIRPLLSLDLGGGSSNGGGQGDGGAAADPRSLPSLFEGGAMRCVLLPIERVVVMPSVGGSSSCGTVSPTNPSAAAPAPTPTTTRGAAGTCPAESYAYDAVRRMRCQFPPTPHYRLSGPETLQAFVPTSAASRACPAARWPAGAPFTIRPATVAPEAEAITATVTVAMTVTTTVMMVVGDGTAVEMQALILLLLCAVAPSADVDSVEVVRYFMSPAFGPRADWVVLANIGLCVGLLLLQWLLYMVVLRYRVAKAIRCARRFGFRAADDAAAIAAALRRPTAAFTLFPTLSLVVAQVLYMGTVAATVALIRDCAVLLPDALVREEKEADDGGAAGDSHGGAYYSSSPPPSSFMLMPMRTSGHLTAQELRARAAVAALGAAFAIGVPAVFAFLALRRARGVHFRSHDWRGAVGIGSAALTDRKGRSSSLPQNGRGRRGRKADGGTCGAEKYRSKQTEGDDDEEMLIGNGNAFENSSAKTVNSKFADEEVVEAALQQRQQGIYWADARDRAAFGGGDGIVHNQKVPRKGRGGGGGRRAMRRDRSPAAIATGTAVRSAAVRFLLPTGQWLPRRLAAPLDAVIGPYTPGAHLWGVLFPFAAGAAFSAALVCAPLAKEPEAVYVMVTMLAAGAVLATGLSRPHRAPAQSALTALAYSFLALVAIAQLLVLRAAAGGGWGGGSAAGLQQPISRIVFTDRHMYLAEGLRAGTIVVDEASGTYIDLLSAEGSGGGGGVATDFAEPPQWPATLKIVAVFGTIFAVVLRTAHAFACGLMDKRAAAAAAARAAAADDEAAAVLGIDLYWRSRLYPRKSYWWPADAVPFAWPRVVVRKGVDGLPEDGMPQNHPSNGNTPAASPSAKEAVAHLLPPANVSPALLSLSHSGGGVGGGGPPLLTLSPAKAAAPLCPSSSGDKRPRRTSFELDANANDDGAGVDSNANPQILFTAPPPPPDPREGALPAATTCTVVGGSGEAALAGESNSIYHRHNDTSHLSFASAPSFGAAGGPLAADGTPTKRGARTLAAVTAVSPPRAVQARRGEHNTCNNHRTDGVLSPLRSFAAAPPSSKLTADQHLVAQQQQQQQQGGTPYRAVAPPSAIAAACPQPPPTHTHTPALAHFRPLPTEAAGLGLSMALGADHWHRRGLQVSTSYQHQHQHTCIPVYAHETPVRYDAEGSGPARNSMSTTNANAINASSFMAFLAARRRAAEDARRRLQQLRAGGGALRGSGGGARKRTPPPLSPLIPLHGASASPAACLSPASGRLSPHAKIHHCGEKITSHAHVYCPLSDTKNDNDSMSFLQGKGAASSNLYPNNCPTYNRNSISISSTAVLPAPATGTRTRHFRHNDAQGRCLPCYAASAPPLPPESRLWPPPAPRTLVARRNERLESIWLAQLQAVARRGGPTAAAMLESPPQSPRTVPRGQNTDRAPIVLPNNSRRCSALSLSGARGQQQQSNNNRPATVFPPSLSPSLARFTPCPAGLYNAALGTTGGGEAAAGLPSPFSGALVPVSRPLPRAAAQPTAAMRYACRLRSLLRRGRGLYGRTPASFRGDDDDDDEERCQQHGPKGIWARLAAFGRRVVGYDDNQQPMARRQRRQRGERRRGAISGVLSLRRFFETRDPSSPFSVAAIYGVSCSCVGALPFTFDEANAAVAVGVPYIDWLLYESDQTIVGAAAEWLRGRFASRQPQPPSAAAPPPGAWEWGGAAAVPSPSDRPLSSSVAVIDGSAVTAEGSAAAATAGLDVPARVPIANDDNAANVMSRTRGGETRWAVCEVAAGFRMGPHNRSPHSRKPPSDFDGVSRRRRRRRNRITEERRRFNTDEETSSWDGNSEEMQPMGRRAQKEAAGECIACGARCCVRRGEVGGRSFASLRSLSASSSSSSSSGSVRSDASNDGADTDADDWWAPQQQRTAAAALFGKRGAAARGALQLHNGRRGGHNAQRDVYNDPLAYYKTVVSGRRRLGNAVENPQSSRWGEEDEGSLCLSPGTVSRSRPSLSVPNHFRLPMPSGGSAEEASVHAAAAGDSALPIATNSLVIVPQLTRFEAKFEAESNDPNISIGGRGDAIVGLPGHNSNSNSNNSPLSSNKHAHQPNPPRPHSHSRLCTPVALTAVATGVRRVSAGSGAYAFANESFLSNTTIGSCAAPPSHPQHSALLVTPRGGLGGDAAMRAHHLLPSPSPTSSPARQSASGVAVGQLPFDRSCQSSVNLPAAHGRAFWGGSLSLLGVGPSDSGRLSLSLGRQADPTHDVPHRELPQESGNALWASRRPAGGAPTPAAYAETRRHVGHTPTLLATVAYMDAAIGDEASLEGEDSAAHATTAPPHALTTSRPAHQLPPSGNVILMGGSTPLTSNHNNTNAMGEMGKRVAKRRAAEEEDVDEEEDEDEGFAGFMPVVRLRTTSYVSQRRHRRGAADEGDEAPAGIGARERSMGPLALSTADSCSSGEEEETDNHAVVDVFSPGFEGGRDEEEVATATVVVTAEAGGNDVAAVVSAAATRPQSLRRKRSTVTILPAGVDEEESVAISLSHTAAACNGGGSGSFAPNASSIAAAGAAHVPSSPLVGGVVTMGRRRSAASSVRSQGSNCPPLRLPLPQQAPADGDGPSSPLNAMYDQSAAVPVVLSLLPHGSSIHGSHSHSHSGSVLAGGGGPSPRFDVASSSASVTPQPSFGRRSAASSVSRRRSLAGSIGQQDGSPLLFLSVNGPSESAAATRDFNTTTAFPFLGEPLRMGSSASSNSGGSAAPSSDEYDSVIDRAIGAVAVGRGLDMSLSPPPFVPSVPPPPPLLLSRPPPQARRAQSSRARTSGLPAPAQPTQQRNGIGQGEVGGGGRLHVLQRTRSVGAPTSLAEGTAARARLDRFKR